MTENRDLKKERRRDKFIKAVSDKIKLIPTLGDPRTILMPVESVWGEKYPEPGMIRLSAGFEETEEIAGNNQCLALEYYLQLIGSIPFSAR